MGNIPTSLNHEYVINSVEFINENPCDTVLNIKASKNTVALIHNYYEKVKGTGEKFFISIGRDINILGPWEEIGQLYDIHTKIYAKRIAGPINDDKLAICFQKNKITVWFTFRDKNIRTKDNFGIEWKETEFTLIPIN